MTLSLLQRMALALLTGSVPSDAAGTTAETTAQRVDLLGFEVCVGTAADPAACDLRLFPAPPPKGAASTDPTLRGLEVSAFGHRVCVGAVPDPARCDMTVGGAAPPGTSVESHRKRPRNPR